MGLSLFPHPEFPSVAVTAISVDAGRRPGGLLALRFQVEGNLDGIVWPPLDGPAGRTDGLWRNTCFEAFVTTGDDSSYCEFNFANLRWAAYRFDAYRQGMSDIDDIEGWASWSPSAGRADHYFSVPTLDDAREWRLGLSAVIEATDGTKSYWALAHAPGPPDFHNPDCFVATLPALERS